MFLGIAAAIGSGRALPPSWAAKRAEILSIVAMLTGALIGALMLLTWGLMPPLAVAALLAGAVPAIRLPSIDGTEPP